MNASLQKTSLTRNQKEAVSLLSIGTFLEYFDLMLYVHMAILLNELFFPKTDPKTASVIMAFSFCTTYLLRPVGALIFGYIGDNIGRKATVIITTFLMAFSSLIMFFLPTYAQIGIAASWIVTLCRMLQGMSSMGETIGAQLYLTEYIKPPQQYAAVAFIRVLPALGTFAALGIGTLTIRWGMNWRYAFLIGAVVAFVGYIARTALRETPDFVSAKKRLLSKKALKTFEENNINKVKTKVALSYFFLEWTWPIWVYVIYIYYGGFLKQNLGYTAADVISHNLYIALFAVVNGIGIVYLSSKIHPLQIMQIRGIIFSLFLPFFMWLLEREISLFNIMALQYFMKAFHPTTIPGDAIVFKYFPILKRFTTASMMFALSRVLMYFVTSFGTIYLTDLFGVWGLLIIIVPVTIGYFYGLNTFINLEKEAGTYHKKTFLSIVFLDNQADPEQEAE